METLLTVEQAAARLQLAPFTVRRHLREGKLRGIKRGAKAWRIPESALFESSKPVPDVASQADGLWARLCALETHNAAIGEIACAPRAVRAEIDRRSLEANDAYLSTPEGRAQHEAELADWRALDGEPFHFPEADDAL